MMKVLHITDWEEHHENSRSRQIKKLTFVSIPNSFDNFAYRMILTEDDFTDIFAAWVIMLQIASKSTDRKTRGHLVKGGKPMTPKHMSAISSAPVSMFERAIEVLTDPEIGWLEWVDLETDVKRHISEESDAENEKSDRKQVESITTASPRRHPSVTKTDKSVTTASQNGEITSLSNTEGRGGDRRGEEGRGRARENAHACSPPDELSDDKTQAVTSMNRWSIRDRKHDLSPSNGEVQMVESLVEDIADDPLDDLSPGETVQQAIERLIAQPKPPVFKHVKYAIACVRSEVEQMRVDEKRNPSVLKFEKGVDLRDAVRARKITHVRIDGGDWLEVQKHNAWEYQSDPDPQTGGKRVYVEAYTAPFGKRRDFLIKNLGSIEGKAAQKAVGV